MDEYVPLEEIVIAMVGDFNARMEMGLVLPPGTGRYDKKGYVRSLEGDWEETLQDEVYRSEAGSTSEASHVAQPKHEFTTDE